VAPVDPPRTKTASTAPSPLLVLAVLGPGAATSEQEEVARRVGRLAAQRGWVVLTGGGPGVMAAACRGAAEAGGLTVGVLPGAGPSETYPNPWVRLPIFTGLGMARNAVNVLSANLCVALGGGPGTLSEIALALKAGVPLWCWRSWSMEPPPGNTSPEPRRIESAEEFLEALDGELAKVVRSPQVHSAHGE